MTNKTQIIEAARDQMKEIARKHTLEILEQFSPEVAELMLRALAALTDAILQQCKEGKDTRDCLIILSRQASESDNMSTILANRVATDILK